MSEVLDPLKGLLHRVRGSVSRHKHGDESGLRIVRDPKDAEIDIVAVHGLGHEGFTSWTTLDPKGSSKPKSWLEELLGKDVPNARIFTYGYISDGVTYRYLVRNVLYGRALDMVKELAAQRGQDHTRRRPLFFIAHSLGGWIVKRALIISSEAVDKELKDIELSTCGVAFFGTLSPGRPASPSPLAHVIRRTTTGFDDDSKQKRRGGHRSLTINTMTPQPSDIEWLENQMEAFKAITANLPRLSFYETKKSPDGFIVGKGDSMAGSDGTQIGLVATHSDLIKFRGRDANYRAFIVKFREMLDKSRTSGLLETKQKVFDLAAVHSLEYLAGDFDVPYELPGEPSAMVPRPRLDNELNSILNPVDDAQQLHLRIATLWGPPGAGTTSLAKSYARARKGDFSFVFWVYAESWETVAGSYLDFADSLVTYYAKDVDRSRIENDLGLTGVAEMVKAKSILHLDTARIKSVVRAVKDWLMRPDNDRWLLVFDHVESSFDIFDFIPLTLSGKIILTSRDRNCCPWGTGVEVTPMNEMEAMKLLELSLADDTLNSATQVNAAEKIVRHLEYHPQRISLAASTMRQRLITPHEYHDELNTVRPSKILGSTIDQSPVTRMVLRVSSMLSMAIIPVALFSGADEVKQVPDRFVNIFNDMKMFQDVGHLEDVFQHLLDNNFIQIPSPTSDSFSSSQSSVSSFESFLLDSSAREHVRQSLSDDEQTDHAWLACNICVDGIRKKELDSETLFEIHDFGRIMAPHAKTCYDDWSSVLEKWPDDGDVAWHVLGNVCMTQGAVEQAIGCFELALKQKGNMGPVERIQASLSLASLLNQAGEFERSKEVLTRIDMPTIDKALSFRVAMAKASASLAQGDLPSASNQYSTLNHEQELELGPTDIHTVTTVQRLASTLEGLNKLEEAQALYRRVHISYQNMFGQAHPLTLEALEDLAHVCRIGNAVDEAEDLYRQSVDLKTRTLGDDHPSTAHALQKLAVIDDLRCRYEAAARKYERALDVMSRTLGRAHPLYTTTMENLALSSRWHARTLADDPEPSTPDKSPTHHLHRRDKESSSSREAVVIRETRRRRALEKAERLYLDVLSIKRTARELYSDKQVQATGDKLQEMYENEDFFGEERGERMEKLMGILRDGKTRRGTL